MSEQAASADMQQNPLSVEQTEIQVDGAVFEAGVEDVQKDGNDEEIVDGVEAMETETNVSDKRIKIGIQDNSIFQQIVKSFLNKYFILPNIYIPVQDLFQIESFQSSNQVDCVLDPKIFYSAPQSIRKDFIKFFHFSVENSIPFEISNFISHISRERSTQNLLKSQEDYGYVFKIRLYFDEKKEFSNAYKKLVDNGIKVILDDFDFLILVIPVTVDQMQKNSKYFLIRFNKVMDDLKKKGFFQKIFYEIIKQYDGFQNAEVVQEFIQVNNKLPDATVVFLLCEKVNKFSNIFDLGKFFIFSCGKLGFFTAAAADLEILMQKNKTDFPKVVEFLKQKFSQDISQDIDNDDQAGLQILEQNKIFEQESVGQKQKYQVLQNPEEIDLSEDDEQNQVFEINQNLAGKVLGSNTSDASKSKQVFQIQNPVFEAVNPVFEQNLPVSQNAPDSENLNTLSKIVEQVLAESDQQQQQVQQPVVQEKAIRQNPVKKGSTFAEFSKRIFLASKTPEKQKVLSQSKRKDFSPVKEQSPASTSEMKRYKHQYGVYYYLNTKHAFDDESIEFLKSINYHTFDNRQRLVKEVQKFLLVHKNSSHKNAWQNVLKEYKLL